MTSIFHKIDNVLATNSKDVRVTSHNGVVRTARGFHDAVRMNC